MKPTQLTPKQIRVLNFIIDFRNERGYSPSTREIAEHFGFVQTAAVNHIVALQRHGAITRIPGRARTIVPVIQGTPSTPSQR